NGCFRRGTLRQQRDAETERGNESEGRQRAPYAEPIPPCLARRNARQSKARRDAGPEARGRCDGRNRRGKPRETLSPLVDRRSDDRLRTRSACETRAGARAERAEREFGGQA